MSVWTWDFKGKFTQACSSRFGHQALHIRQEDLVTAWKLHVFLLAV